VGGRASWPARLAGTTPQRARREGTAARGAVKWLGLERSASGRLAAAAADGGRRRRRRYTFPRQGYDSQTPLLK